MPVTGADDTTSVRWRVFGGSWCICSFYAPHAGVGLDAKLSFWRDFVHRATHIHQSMGLPMIIAGDANVWHPHFRMRTRTCDSLVLPSVDLLISSCNVEIWNPREQDTQFFIGAHAAEDIVTSQKIPPAASRQTGVNKIALHLMRRRCATISSRDPWKLEQAHRHCAGCHTRQQ